MACAVVCEHCQAPIENRCTVFEGNSYHEACRKCYVCSETNLRGAEVFKGVIFCSSCSQKIFQGCSTARKTKPNARRMKNKHHRRRSHRAREMSNTGHPYGIIAMTGLLGSSGSSKSISDPKEPHNSKSVVVSAKMALTVPKPTFKEVFQTKNITKNGTEVGMTTEATQQLLKELNCPVVTTYHQNKMPKASPTSIHSKKKHPCSDLRVAELGTSREIANMALRHKNELPVIIKSHHRKPITSTSESIPNGDSECGCHREEWMDSAYSTLDGSSKSHCLNRRFRSMLRIPYSAFKRNILKRSSLISDITSERDSECVLKKIKTAFRQEWILHQRRGLRRLFSTINRKQVPNKLGWLNLVTNVYCTHSNSAMRLSKGLYQKRCKHFHTSHSYRCMRAQAMKLAGPTKSELAVLRGKIRKVIAPPFLRSMAITYSKRPAIMMTHACGSSKAPSCNGKKN